LTVGAKKREPRGKKFGRCRFAVRVKRKGEAREKTQSQAAKWKQNSEEGYGKEMRNGQSSRCGIKKQATEKKKKKFIKPLAINNVTGGTEKCLVLRTNEKTHKKISSSRSPGEI